MLQVLLSQVHRLRALVLLGRFLDMGLWAVDLALSVGIFPYVLKLLQVGGGGGAWGGGEASAPGCRGFLARVRVQHGLYSAARLGESMKPRLRRTPLRVHRQCCPLPPRCLQTTSSDLRTTLVFIWAKILALDTSCQVPGVL